MAPTKKRASAKESAANEGARKTSKNAAGKAPPPWGDLEPLPKNIAKLRKSIHFARLDPADASLSDEVRTGLPTHIDSCIRELDDFKAKLVELKSKVVRA